MKSLFLVLARRRWLPDRGPVSEEGVWQPRDFRPKVLGWREVHPCSQSSAENQVCKMYFHTFFVVVAISYCFCAFSIISFSAMSSVNILFEVQKNKNTVPIQSVSGEVYNVYICWAVLLHTQYFIFFRPSSYFGSYWNKLRITWMHTFPSRFSSLMSGHCNLSFFAGLFLRDDCPFLLIRASCLSRLVTSLFFTFPGCAWSWVRRYTTVGIFRGEETHFDLAEWRLC